MNRYTVDTCGMGPEGTTGRHYVTASSPRNAALKEIAGSRRLHGGSAVVAGAEVFHDAHGTIYVVRKSPTVKESK